jgi:Crp-like helix-turn-helix domain
VLALGRQRHTSSQTARMPRSFSLTISSRTACRRITRRPQPVVAGAVGRRLDAQREGGGRQDLRGEVRLAPARQQVLSTEAALDRRAERASVQARPLPGQRTARLRPPPKHADIASRLLTHREAVSRLLSDLRREGLVERGRGELVIRDIPRLREFAEELQGDRGPGVRRSGLGSRPNPGTCGPSGGRPPASSHVTATAKARQG